MEFAVIISLCSQFSANLDVFLLYLSTPLSLICIQHYLEFHTEFTLPKDSFLQVQASKSRKLTSASN